MYWSLPESIRISMWPCALGSSGLVPSCAIFVVLRSGSFRGPGIDQGIHPKKRRRRHDFWRGRDSDESGEGWKQPSVCMTMWHYVHPDVISEIIWRSLYLDVFGLLLYYLFHCWLMLVVSHHCWCEQFYLSGCIRLPFHIAFPCCQHHMVQ